MLDDLAHAGVGVVAFDLGHSVSPLTLQNLWQLYVGETRSKPACQAFSTGPPAFSQPPKPSFRCAASKPMSCNVATEMAERQPEAQ